MRPYPHTTDASALLGVRLQTHKAQGRIYTAYPNLANLRWLLPASQLCAGLVLKVSISQTVCEAGH
jgi:hypothetical protein